MESLFTLDSLVTLFMLVLLQAVLGFDNLLYISLESQRAPAESQAKVRKLGIGIAVVLRIVLLIILTQLIQLFQDELFSFNIPGIVEGTFNFHALIVLFGGVFIIYTATKEVMHMMKFEEAHVGERKPRSVAMVVTWIVLMNLVFSFDSILSAMALTDKVIIMAVAIIIGGILMIALADTVSNFLQKNRMYEVLGLFILFVVGIMLVSEGGHLAHMKILESEIHPMTKATFYFVIVVLVLTDIVQSRYQRKLLRNEKAIQAQAAANQAALDQAPVNQAES